MYIELNYTLNKLVLGTAVSAFTTRPQPKFYSIYIYILYNKCKTKNIKIKILKLILSC